MQEKARKERIELVTRQAGRRMLNQRLASGWCAHANACPRACHDARALFIDRACAYPASRLRAGQLRASTQPACPCTLINAAHAIHAFHRSAWKELWQAKTYALKRLREAANRLRQAEPSQSFYGWRQVIDNEHMLAAMKAKTLQSKSISEQLSHWKAEAAQLETTCNVLKANVRVGPTARPDPQSARLQAGRARGRTLASPLAECATTRAARAPTRRSRSSKRRLPSERLR